MILIVAGSIGTGKSSVCRILKSKLKNCSYIDADKVGHDVLKKSNIKQRLVKAFGKKILVNGSISRKKLGDIAFGSRKNVEKLNRITHPEINKSILKKINRKKNIIIESSVYHGLKLGRKYILIYVKAKKALVEKRLKSKELIKRKAFHKHIKGADFTIYNNGSRAELKKKVENILSKIK